MPPVMSPAFDPPSLTIGVAVFGVELAETEVPVVFEVLEGPIITPGPIPGPIKSKTRVRP